MEADRREAVGRALQLCELGFDRRSRGYYARVTEVLTPHRSDERIDICCRLAEGGASLISPRFAYPHIASRLRLLDEPEAA